MINGSIYRMALITLLSHLTYKNVPKFETLQVSAISIVLPENRVEQHQSITLNPSVASHWHRNA
jgi:hypothetical protein